MAEDDEVIDPRIFIKQLAPDQLGMFEPLSGLMLLNISRAELVELQERFVAGTPTDFDVSMIHTINHEAYHFAQVASSGYVFHREARLLMVLNAAEPAPEVAIEPEMQTILDAAREEAGDDPELLLRYERMVAMLKGHNQFTMYDQRAAQGDHSMVGALMPGFFAHMTQLAESERTASADGLSILGVIEGSAVVHAQMLMHGDEDAAPYHRSGTEDAAASLFADLRAHRCPDRRASARAAAAGGGPGATIHATAHRVPAAAVVAGTKRAGRSDRLWAGLD